MNKTSKLLTHSLFISAIALASFGFKILLPTGPDPGHTGSPADGKNCTECHGGTAQTASSSFITSDIPMEGYTPGQTYTFTVTVPGTGNKGFQISPQDAMGNLIGTLTAGSGNVVNNTKYVNHNAAKSGDPATWNFMWTAPSAGVGNVTFYGAYVASKPNVFTGSYTIDEASASGISDLTLSIEKIYPNPVTDKLNIELNHMPEQNSRISLVSLDGSRVIHLEQKDESNMQFDIPENAANGYYILEIASGQRYLHKKILINK